MTNTKKTDDYVTMNSKHDLRVMTRAGTHQENSHSFSLSLLTFQVLSFSSAYQSCKNIVHIFGQKISLHSFQKTEIIQSMFSRCHAIKLTVSNKTKLQNPHIFKNYDIH